MTLHVASIVSAFCDRTAAVSVWFTRSNMFEQLKHDFLFFSLVHREIRCERSLSLALESISTMCESCADDLRVPCKLGRSEYKGESAYLNGSNNKRLRGPACL